MWGNEKSIRIWFSYSRHGSPTRRRPHFEVYPLLHTREVATEGAGRGEAEGPRPLPRKRAKKLPRHPFREHSFSPATSPLETTRFFNASRVARANPEFPLCATEGIGDEKARFLGFRTFASRERGFTSPLFRLDFPMHLHIFVENLLAGA